MGDIIRAYLNCLGIIAAIAVVVALLIGIGIGYLI